MSGRAVMLLACLLCSGCGIVSADSFAEQTARLSEYDVVIPKAIFHRQKRLANQTRESEQGHNTETLTYSVRIKGKDHLLHLEKNRDFLPEDFVQYSYNDNGELMTSYPRVQEHCYYHGQVEGLEHSMVALSTCSGLRGIILIGEQSYAIEPVAESPANEHLLFLLEHSQHEPFACGVSTEMPPPLEEDPETPRQAETRHSDTVGSMTRLFRKKRNLPQTRYVELILVADKSRYVYKNSNETAVNEELIQMANLLDGYYQQLNIRVILVGVVIWKTQDPINVDGQAGQVLDSFVKWRKTYLVPRKRNDMAMLLVGRNSSYNGGILGMAVVGTVCSPSSAGGISVFIANSLQYYSTVVAHEMGHNLGMNHDDKICDCNGSCIMHALAGGSTKFSTCSSNDFINLILQGGGICLNNQPLPSDVFSEPSCGNGLVEQGEQCDCGKPQDCTNKCCDAATCKFSKGSACAQGLCCENCQMNVAGTPCRESVNPCDLPEFCLGNSPSCPIDYYIMDGFPCANNTAYCFEGRCQTYDYQCQQLFGNDAEKAVDACFVDSNTRGDRFGNCGRNGATYIQCTLANVKCGKIQCSNVDITKLPYGATITLHYVGQNQCFNADFDLGSDVVDPAYVNPGSSCDQGKTCFNYQCSNTSALNYTCDTQTQCNGRGVCDNLGHCYCNNGWAPPNCDRSGSGGSIDSGPTKIDTSLRDGLLIFFLLVVPVLILIGAILFFVFKRGGLQRCRRRKRSSQNQSRDPAPRTSTPRAAPQRAQPASRTPAPAAPPSYRPPPTPRNVNGNFGIPGYENPAVPPQVNQQGPGVPRPILPTKP